MRDRRGAGMELGRDLPRDEERQPEVVAARQMSGFGGMISVEVESEERAHHLVEHTELFFLAESLGGVESLIEMPLPMTHATTADTNIAVTPELVRISVGIEHVDDLIADLDQALG